MNLCLPEAALLARKGLVGLAQESLLYVGKTIRCTRNKLQAIHQNTWGEYWLFPFNLSISHSLYRTSSYKPIQMDFRYPLLYTKTNWKITEPKHSWQEVATFPTISWAPLPFPLHKTSSMPLLRICGNFLVPQRGVVLLQNDVCILFMRWKWKKATWNFTVRRFR